MSTARWGGGRHDSLHRARNSAQRPFRPVQRSRHSGKKGVSHATQVNHRGSRIRDRSRGSRRFAALAQEKRVYEKADNASPVCAGCHEQAHLHDEADGARRPERRRRLVLPGLPRRRVAAPQGPRQEQAGQRAQHQGRDGRAEVGDLPRPATPGRVTSRPGRRASTARSTSAASAATTSTARSRRPTPATSTMRSSRVRRTRRPSAAWPTRSASAATATRAPRS